MESSNVRYFSAGVSESLRDGGRKISLMNTSSNRVFSYEGVPIREGTLRRQFAKNRASSPQLRTLNGVDLRKSLNDYLQSHALGHLKK